MLHFCPNIFTVGSGVLIRNGIPLAEDISLSTEGKVLRPQKNTKYDTHLFGPPRLRNFPKMSTIIVYLDLLIYLEIEWN